MGCGATKEVILRAKSDDDNSGRIALQSTGGLQLILQQSTLRRAFHNFTCHKWTPSNKGNSAYYVDNAKIIAINCLNFWTDARDFCKVKKSAFRTYRAVFIFEKYLMHGASKKVPVSSNVLDDCVSALFNGNTEEIEADIFTAAELEALDFLVAEVFPYFEQTSYSGLAKQQSMQLIRVISGKASTSMTGPAQGRGGGLEREVGNSSVYQDEVRSLAPIRSTERDTLIAIMDRILSDKEYLAAFKNYLVSQRDERVLLAYHECLETAERLTDLSTVVDPEVRLAIFLHAANAFYDRYITMGAAQRIVITEGTYGDLMRRFDNSVGIEHEVLLPVEHECFEYMIRMHLEGFLATPEYRQLVRMGRRTVLLLYYHLKMGRDQPCGDTASANGANGGSEALSGVTGVKESPMHGAGVRLLPDTGASDSNVGAGSDDTMCLMDRQSDSGAFSPHRSPSTQLSPTWSPTSPQQPDIVTTNGTANKHISTMDSVEITAWLTKGGRRSSTITASTGSTPLGACSPQISELFSPVNHTDMRELKNFIRSGYDELLSRYLSTRGVLSLMHFYQSASRFQEAHFNHDVERLSECTMLFERYISRNAEDKVALPEPIRRDIVKQLMRGKQTIYSLAAKWVIHNICSDHWGDFKKEVNANAESAQVAGGSVDGHGVTVGSAQITAADEGSFHLPAMADYSSDNSLNSDPQKVAQLPPHSPNGIDQRLSGRDLHPPQSLHLGSSQYNDADHIDAVSDFACRAAKAFPPTAASTCVSRGSFLRDGDHGVLVCDDKAVGERRYSLGYTTSHCGVPVLSPVPMPVIETCEEAPSSENCTGNATSTSQDDDAASPAAEPPTVQPGGRPMLFIKTDTISVPLPNVSTASTGTAAAAAVPLPRTPHPKVSVPPMRAKKTAGLQTHTIPEYLGNSSKSVSIYQALHPVSPGASKAPALSVEPSSFHRQLCRIAGVSISNLSAESSNAFARALSTTGSAKNKSGKLAPLQCARTVLEHPQCCCIFKGYLDREGLSQTVIFFIEIEEFRRIPSFDFQLLRARKIYYKYMHELSVMPVPVTTFTRNEILKCITGGVVLPTLFKCASEEVVRYIEIFQYPRFQRSPEMVSVQLILSSEQQHPTHLQRRSSLSMRAMPVQDTLNLKNILKNQTCTRYFKDYCTKICCCENLLFWLDVDNYVNLPGSDYMRRVACKIYKKYIADGSKMQVNVSYGAKQEIFAHLLNGDRQLFKKAQQEVFHVMKSDTMQKFVNSAEFALMVKSLYTDQQIGLKTPAPISPTHNKPASAGFRSLKDRELPAPVSAQLAPVVCTTSAPFGAMNNLSAINSGSGGAAPTIVVSTGSGLRSSVTVGVLAVNSASTGSVCDGKSPTAALKSTSKPQMKLH